MSRDISVNLIARTERYTSGMQRAAKDTASYSKTADNAARSTKRMTSQANTAARATANTSAKMGKAQQAATQMTFAIDDAASVYGTAGLAGAVRGAANNLTMMAAIMGGVKAQIAATAVMVGIQLWMALNKTKEKTKEANEALEQYRETLKSVADAPIKALDLTKRIRDIETGDEASKQLKEKRAEYDALAKSVATLQANLGGVTKGLEESRTTGKIGNAFLTTMSASGVGSGTLGRKLGIEDQLKKTRITDEQHKSMLTQQATLQEELRKKQLEMMEVAKERNRLQERRTQLVKQEQAAAALKEKIDRQSLAAEREMAAIRKEREDRQARIAAGGVLRQSLFEQANPEQARRRQIADERRQRIEMINALGDQFTSEQRKAMRLQADIIAARQLRDLNGPTKQREAIMTGPTAIARGSQQALELQRSTILGKLLPKPKKTEDLLSRLLKQQQMAFKEEQKQTKAFMKFNTAAPKVGAFSGGA